MVKALSSGAATDEIPNSAAAKAAEGGCRAACGGTPGAGPSGAAPGRRGALFKGVGELFLRRALPAPLGASSCDDEAAAGVCGGTPGQFAR